jgi:DNA-binding NarL/FixJ family response regulator
MPADAIQVSIVSPSRLFRQALSARLGREPEIQLVGEVSLNGTNTGSPEIVLIDAQLNPSDAVRHASLQGGSPDARMIAVGVAEAQEAMAWIEAGVAAVVECDGPLTAVVDMVRSVHQGRPNCSPLLLAAISRRLSHLAVGSAAQDASDAESTASGCLVQIAATPQPLTRREAEVARLAAEGLLDKQIARRLGIQRKTAKNYVHQVLRKLGATSRRQIARHLAAGQKLAGYSSGARSDTSDVENYAVFAAG